jgi:hypothetical protein
MKKVLILSYFFPPCNLAGSNRAYGWAKYLKAMGYYPIIITRNWSIPLEHPEDAYISAGTGIVHEKKDDFEVYFLPYKSNLRDRIFIKHKYKKWNIIRKFLTFIELLFQNCSQRIIPFRNIYYFAEDLIKKNEDIKIVITTGNPFIFFKFGYLLKKQFKLLWIADYRDDWNTNLLKRKKSIPDKIVSIFESRSEKRWIARADTFLSVSEEYVDKIEKFTKKKGHVIGNGFVEDEYEIEVEPFDHFAVIYNGTLYDTQQIEIFSEVYKAIIDKYSGKVKIHLYFIGLAYEKNQIARIENILSGYEAYYVITSRIPKNEMIKIQFKCSLLLMIAHGDVKGVPSSKLYQYIRCYKNILLCPTDNDIMEKTLLESGLGLISSNFEEAFNHMERLILEYMKNGSLKVNINYDYISQFSRKEQTKNLAELLDKYTN